MSAGRGQHLHAEDAAVDDGAAMDPAATRYFAVPVSAAPWGAPAPAGHS
jgi:hypothetical protein